MKLQPKFLNGIELNWRKNKKTTRQQNESSGKQSQPAFILLEDLAIFNSSTN
jgi:hypothetical protein